MATARMTESAKIRSELTHPIVDVDGHVVELTPVVQEYVKQVGGGDMVERYLASAPIREAYFQGNVARSPDDRRDRWTNMAHWWSQPTDTLDLATVGLPRLLNQRLEEFGVDFTTLYPSQGLFAPMIDDPELRRVACRAHNKYAAEILGEFPDRMTGVAVVPMFTPEEAVEDLEYAVNELGLKGAVFSGSVRRPVPRVQRERPDSADLGYRMELFALDGDYDYDPLWAKCVELKVAATFHGGIGAPSIHSPSNYVFNHVGSLMKGNHHLCKALFMGGVTNRFPTLNFAFLEGGVGWAVQLFADLMGHWEKRNAKAIHGLDPALIDRDRFNELVLEYGDELTRTKAEDIRVVLDRNYPRPVELNDFAACGIETAEDLRDRFVPNFFFGCEADDPVNAVAFDTSVNPLGSTLQAVYGSDIGHWDVPVMIDVLKEAYELVEDGAIDLDQFKQFTFTNPVKLHAGMNPDFFKGTRVEADVNKLLGAGG